MNIIKRSDAALVKDLYTAASRHADANGGRIAPTIQGEFLEIIQRHRQEEHKALAAKNLAETAQAGLSR